MNISKTDLDALNAVVTITLDRKDYEKRVDSVLSNYKKNAKFTLFYIDFVLQTLDF